MSEPAKHAERGILVDPRVIAAGGGVALIGLIVLAAFVWMVPNAASREVRAACQGLRPNPLNPEMCPNGHAPDGGPCTLPMKAPDFTVYDHAGKPVHLSDFRGKVVLVDFWASWCITCKYEKPQIAAAADELVGDDFHIMAVASDRGWSEVLIALVDALTLRPGLGDPKDWPAVPLSTALKIYEESLPSGVPFQVYLDKPVGDTIYGQIAETWGLTGFPESAIVDRAGNIRYYFVGKRDWSSEVAKTCIRSVIDGE